MPYHGSREREALQGSLAAAGREEDYEEDYYESTTLHALGMPPRVLRPKVDLGPALEPIERLVARAERAAELVWADEHGGLPGWMQPLPPDELTSPATRDELWWPRRWFAAHLFELPPLGEVPARWLTLLG